MQQVEALKNSVTQRILQDKGGIQWDFYIEDGCE